MSGFSSNGKTATFWDKRGSFTVRAIYDQELWVFLNAPFYACIGSLFMMICLTAGWHSTVLSADFSLGFWLVGAIAVPFLGLAGLAREKAFPWKETILYAALGYVLETSAHGGFTSLWWKTGTVLALMGTALVFIVYGVQAWTRRVWEPLASAVPFSIAVVYIAGTPSLHGNQVFGIFAATFSMSLVAVINLAGSNALYNHGVSRQVD